MITLKNIAVPQIDDSEIKIHKNNSKDLIVKYFNDVNTVSQKYFSQSFANTIPQTIQSSNAEGISDLSKRANAIVTELKSLEVPSDALQLHKDLIGIFELMPQISNLPPQSSLDNVNDQKSNQWYDKTQAYMYLAQQYDIEIKRLSIKYK